MSKSKHKIRFINREVFKKSLINFNIGEQKLPKKKKKSSITLFNRNSLIPNTLLNKKIFIYTGLRFISIKVKSMHLGLRLGEFVLTRRLKSNKKRKKGKK